MSEISHKKIKILFPSMHYPPVIGGIETWTKEIAEGLSQRADVFVITGKVKGEANQETKNGVRIIRVGKKELTDLSHSPLLYTLFSLFSIYWRARKLIRQEGIMLLHCSGFLSGLIGYCLKRKFSLPYIVTIQSLQENKPTQWLKKMVYKDADLCIGASEAIIDYLIRIGVKKKVEVENPIKVSNGIDIGRFSNLNKQEARKRLGFSADDFVVVSTGRLDKRKGFSYLIEAIAETNYKLLLVGDGEERGNLENLARELKCANRVKFVGAIANNDVPNYLAAGDCFCLPSLEEGFGIAILEAMAATLPVVASSVGGILDLVEDGKTGLLVPPADKDAIKQALEKVKTNPNLAANAKEKLINFTWQGIIEQAFILSKSVIENCNNGLGLSNLIERDDWNNFIKENNGHIFNTYEWGEFKSDQGWFAQRHSVITSSGINAIFSILEKKLPFFNKKIWYLPRGPVFASKSQGDFPMLELLVNFAKSQNVVSLKISPDILFQNDLKDYLNNLGFKETNAYQLHKCTIRVGLEGDIFSKFKKNTRWEVKRAQEKGVVIKSGNLDDFYKTYQASMQNNSQDFLKKDYIQGLVRFFPNNHLILTAYHNNILLAGIFILFLQDRAWYMFGGSTREAGNFYASQFLQAEAMKMLQAKGVKEYDLQGVACNPQTKSEIGAFQFKDGFGGERVELIGEYDYIASNFWHSLIYKILFPLYKMFKKEH